MRTLLFIAPAVLILTGCSFNSFYYFPDTNKVVASPNAIEYYIPYDGDKKIHTLFFKQDYPIASVFILHGNGGSLGGWQSVAEMLWEEGYQAYIIDYPGFGNSDGKPKHTAVIESTQKAFDHFISLPGVDSTKKIIMGFSLGGNLALKIGPDNQEYLDAMVVEGLFNNYRDIGINHTPKILQFAPFLMLGSKFKGEETIKNWTKPLLVVHSKEDHDCPYEMGKEVYENAASEKKELWTIDGPHIAGFAKYQEQYFYKIRRLIE